MEALSDESSFSRHVREKDEDRYAGGNLVLWIAAIAVLIGLNFGSWSFCMWVFGQPEHPMNYRLLTKLDKMDPIRGFSPVSAPRGEFHSPKDLYADLYSFEPTQLRAYNGILKRNYLENYAGARDVTYLAGEFEVLSVERLGEEDVFRSGIGIRAKAAHFPDVILDLALPSPDPPGTFDLGAGEPIRLEESTMCAAVLHVERLPDERMIFTAVPLVSKRSPGTDDLEQYEFADGATVTVSPPERIQLEPERWPITEPEEPIQAKPVGTGKPAADSSEGEDGDGAGETTSGEEESTGENGA